MKSTKLFFNWSLLTTRLLLLLLITTSSLSAQTISLTSTYLQDFNTLVSTGTSSVVPTGWLFTETGTNANTTYSAGTGSGTAGDSYSFGPASNADRALGGLLSGSLIPTIGAGFTNNSGNVINSITISYAGEQWRLGALARPDRLDFQFSTDATNLTTGTWISETNLNFIAPVTGPTTGAINGNDAGARTIISYTISGLNIVNGAGLYIRWNDFNATSSDDGLGVDERADEITGFAFLG